MQYAFAQIQEAFDAIYREIRVPGLSWLFRGPIALWSRMNRISTMPSDKLGHKVAQAMQQRGEQRDRITDGIYLPEDKKEAFGRYENAMELIAKAQPIYRKIHVATKKKELPKTQPRFVIDEALEKDILNEQEAETIRKAEEARVDAVQVDEFTLEEYQIQTPSKPKFKTGTEPEGISE